MTQKDREPAVIDGDAGGETDGVLIPSTKFILSEAEVPSAPNNRVQPTCLISAAFRRLIPSRPFWCLECSAGYPAGG